MTPGHSEPTAPPPAGPEEPPEELQAGAFARIRLERGMPAIPDTDWKKLNPTMPIPQIFFVYGVQRKVDGEWRAYVGRMPEGGAEKIAAALAGFNPNLAERSTEGVYATVIEVPAQALVVDEKVAAMKPRAKTEE